MMRPITKWSTRITRIDKLSWFIQRAFSVATNGQPGPVFLELPYDVGGIYHHWFIEVGNPRYIASKKIRMAGDPKLISEAVDLLLKVKRPVALAGNGAMLSGAAAEFKEFVELLGIPFLTTPGGRGIMSEEHPLAVGVPGLYRSKVGKEVLNDADLLITIGSRNESFQTHNFVDFPKGAKYIQVDIAPFEIGRNWIPDIGIGGDAKIVLQQLLAAIKEKTDGSQNFKALPRVKEIVKAKQGFDTEVKAECMVDTTPLTAKRVVYELSQVFGRNTILVNENGSQDCWSYVFPYYKVQDGSECVPVAEQTYMGMGVVGAIASKLVRPEKNVVCVTGDGAFQMYMKELPTAAQYKAGCTWVVLDNSALGWPKHLQMEKVGWTTANFKIQPDFVKWAEACKCFGKRVEKTAEITPALEAALRANKQGIPAVLDFIIGIDMSHFERSA
jgi:acetolactate synthase-1/2/3 large subunit